MASQSRLDVIKALTPERRAQHEALMKLWQELTEQAEKRFRLSISVAYHDGMTDRQIGDVLEVSDYTVRAWRGQAVEQTGSDSGSGHPDPAGEQQPNG